MSHALHKLQQSNAGHQVLKAGSNSESSMQTLVYNSSFPT